MWLSRRSVSSLFLPSLKKAVTRRPPQFSSHSSSSSSILNSLLRTGTSLNKSFSTQSTGASTKSKSGKNHSVAQKLYEQSANDKKWVHSVEFFSAINKSLHILCERGSFDYADLCIPEKNHLKFTETWYSDKESVNHFLPLRSKLDGSSAEASATANKAFQTKKPVWEPISEPYTSLVKADLGIKSVLSIPIVHDGQVLAVETFLSRHEVDSNGAQSVEDLTQLAKALISVELARQVNIKIKDDQDQMAIVYNYILNEGVFNATTVYQEVDWYFNHLQLQAYYFERFPAHVIAKHIHSFIAAKKLAQTRGKPEDIWLQLEHGSSAFFICPNDHEANATIENKMERLIANVPEHQAYSLTYFRSRGTVIPNGSTHLSMYIFDTHDYNQPHTEATETDLYKIASGIFLRDKTHDVRSRYQEIINDTSGKLSPVLKIYEPYYDGTIPVMFAVRRVKGRESSLLWSTAELIYRLGLVCERKFVETFSNGLDVYSFYFRNPDMSQVKLFLDQFSLLYLVPSKTLLTPLFLNSSISAELYAYGSAVSRCIYYFLNKPSEEFKRLQTLLKDDPAGLSSLNLLNNRLRGEAVSLQRILTCFINNLSLFQELYAEFKSVSSQNRELNADIERKIAKEVENDLDEEILLTLHSFNSNLLKTNFYRQRKSSLSFRLDPAIVSQTGLTPPYGIFFVCGLDFQGFHIRFRDVARGGIRLIRSSGAEAYNRNLETLFAENYNLANTQNRKNKDLPEFGSKGTILLNTPDAHPFLAFQKYVSGLLDLLMPDSTITDHYGKREILFLGPDEGTADYMEWAAVYSKKRNYPFWKAFTTGKPRSLGGIPHDLYGMTTRSVHRFVVGCLEKKGLDETKVTKLQTGGPDGDLGSNEILLSKDKTVGIVDGSGVLFDPHGINRDELYRLVSKRQMIQAFNKAALSKDGFKILVSDRDIYLPNGEHVESGMQFRNSFHLNPISSADMFVPCGGRPESVTLANVSKLLHKDGSPRFKIIVEGANLFFTNDARMFLEDAGAIVYKDASTNKGGVFSSSLEVLASLAMNDAEHKEHMQVTDLSNIPQFYQDYVVEIQQRIEENAAFEFNLIWHEHERTKIHRTILTDKVSDKINYLNDLIQHSSLYANATLRARVFNRAIPRKLIDLLGLETIIQRIPENYAQAIFGSYLASRFVYQHGLETSDLSFYQYMEEWLKA